MGKGGGKCCSHTDAEVLTDFFLPAVSNAWSSLSLESTNYDNFGRLMCSGSAISPCPGYTTIPCCCFWKGKASKCARHSVLCCQGFTVGCDDTRDTKPSSLPRAGLASLVSFHHPHLGTAGDTDSQEFGQLCRETPPQLFQAHSSVPHCAAVTLSLQELSPHHLLAAQTPNPPSWGSCSSLGMLALLTCSRD